jgi:hypothetical protein
LRSAKSETARDIGFEDTPISTIRLIALLRFAKLQALKPVVFQGVFETKTCQRNDYRCPLGKSGRSRTFDRPDARNENKPQSIL